MNWGVRFERRSLAPACVLGFSGSRHCPAGCFNPLHHLPDVASANEKVWFTGHWGFQYYMQQRGALPLDELAPACHVGDIVVVALNNYGQPPASIDLKTVGLLSLEKLPFLSLLNESMGAQFYFSTGDELPLIFGPVPPESFGIFRVTGCRK